MFPTLTRSQFTAGDGQTIHFHEKGAGTPIVMLHGWTADHNEWIFFVDELARHHRVVLWDARGHGMHPLNGKDEPTVARMARDLHELFEHLALDRFTLVGHSMGALTSWEYIRQFGSTRIGKLCVIDQSPKLLTDDGWKFGIYGDFTTERAAQFAADLRADFAEAMLRFCAYGLNQKARIGYDRNTRGWQGERERLRRQDPLPLIRIWESLVPLDFRKLLPEIDLPTLLVYGDESNFYLPDTGEHVRSLMPRASLHLYEGTDHSPHLWQAQRFTGDLLAFIAE